MEMDKDKVHAEALKLLELAKGVDEGYRAVADQAKASGGEYELEAATRRAQHLAKEVVTIAKLEACQGGRDDLAQRLQARYSEVMGALYTAASDYREFIDRCREGSSN